MNAAARRNTHIASEVVIRRSPSTDPIGIAVVDSSRDKLSTRPIRWEDQFLAHLCGEHHPGGVTRGHDPKTKPWSP